jgi:Zn-dependent peptidase ImmA (M78 family)
VPLKTYDALGREYNNNRERFTVAHEAGHVILHRHYFETQVLIAARAVSGPVVACQNPEWQANAAAGALLMPLTTFYHKYTRLRGNGFLNFPQLNELASTFQVSTDAVSIRIQTLRNKGVKDLIARFGL